MTPASTVTSISRTAEQRAQDVVHRIVSQAEPIPVNDGGGHKLDMQILYEEVVAALRETIDDLAFCSESNPS
ncbi:MAG: hypothetical protein RIE06_10185 [Roseibium album]|uniref:Uncharacterized protein n=1 Tax=Roseibium album TaxID=311410 RepID=A0A0M6Z752_9HYPH|nr:hypothetical protein [Roseibium album]MBG6145684.1 hypothetical protein [Labrenzia sp. EL_142]MBG6157618.1 hypothetical protein [Labrenzia sp. EL_162]MBG6163051.1 hypothetical protein [Labrenzia sp. EL_195]MBG6174554.1 hypothetical protein [Labrenzia sp. EL_132]MBG6195989.1 hypothetical protein [Labrenzia sp. EL_159]MBG6201411.1 hypothetical protein [Labrenzia sp. EL_13]MBG6229164.1 hypothetical protein [Labrenzia sp. EL_208]MCR9058991.1 hypothetical protein [Paracoccaceae bacterium]